MRRSKQEEQRTKQEARDDSFCGLAGAQRRTTGQKDRRWRWISARGRGRARIASGRRDPWRDRGGRERLDAGDGRGFFFEDGGSNAEPAFALEGALAGERFVKNGA